MSRYVAPGRAIDEKAQNRFQNPRSGKPWILKKLRGRKAGCRERNQPEGFISSAGSRDVICTGGESHRVRSGGRGMRAAGITLARA